MAVDIKRKRTPDEHVENVKAAIRARFPAAEFEVDRVNRYEYRIRVFGDIENVDDVFDLTQDLQSDILETSGILILVLPLGPREEN